MISKFNEFQDGIRLIEGNINNLIEVNKVPGLSIAIIYDQDILWSKGFGYADVEEGIPASSETVYPILSVTKLFTATMLMQMVEKGMLQLDDPLDKYIKDLKIKPYFNDSNPASFTFRQVASHCSGLPREAPLNYWVTLKFPAIDEILESMKYTELMFSPMTKYHYSNLGIALLAYALENIYGNTYDSYMKENIFMPLKMYDTSFKPSEIKGKVTKRYTLKKDFFSDLNMLPDLKAFTPEGGLYSNVLDMAKFISMQFSKGEANILNETSLKIMHSPQYVITDFSGSMGIGWAVNKFSKYKSIYHMGGLRQGESTIVYALPELKLGIVILSNADTDGDLYNEVIKAMKILTPIAEEYEINNYNNTQLDIKPYVGKYNFSYFEDGVILEFKIENQLLTACFPQMPFIPPIKFNPVAGTRYRMNGWVLPFFENEIAYFEKDDNGEITSVYISGVRCEKI